MTVMTLYDKFLPRPQQIACITLAIAIGFQVTGCWVPIEVGHRMKADIDRLNRELYTTRSGIERQEGRLVKQRQLLEEQLQRADEKLAEIGKTLGDINRSARMTDADFGVQLQDMVKELQALRGTLELSNHRIEKIETHFREDNSLKKRVEDLEKLSRRQEKKAPRQKSKATAKVSDKPPSKPRTEGAALKKKGSDKTQLMQQAKKLVDKGKTKEARQAYRNIILRWPNVLGITDEAHYRLGEIFYQNKEYRHALQEFIKIVERFPSGKMVDNAFYRIGNCSIQIGNLEDAAIFFNEVVQNHQSSPLVKASKSKLKEIEERKKAKKKAATKLKKSSESQKN